MNIKCSVFIAVSFDGFISRPDGSIDWLQVASAVMPDGEDCGYRKFLTSVDTVVMGRNTFEQVMTFDEWPYGHVPVIVLSHHVLPLPENAPAGVMASRESPPDLVTRLSGEGKHHLFVEGGLTIQSFLADGLIDEITITIVPILIGAGTPLFGPIPDDIELKHLDTRVYKFGFVQHKYRIDKTG